MVSLFSPLIPGLIMQVTWVSRSGDSCSVMFLLLVSVWSLLVNIKVSDSSTLLARWSHWILGAGLPVAEQLNVTFLFLSLGSLVVAYTWVLTWDTPEENKSLLLTIIKTWRGEWWSYLALWDKSGAALILRGKH